MTLHEMPDLEQRSEEWHAQRRGIVTASVVGQLITTRYPGAEAYDCPDCGSSPGVPCRSMRRGAVEGGAIKTFHSARTDTAVTSRNDANLVIEPADNDTSRGLVRLLAAERITGYTEPTWISADMMRGIEDEPRAVAKYSEHYAPVTRIGFMVRDDWGYRIGYSPDGLVGDDGLVEVKSRRQKHHLATILSDAVPAENMAQLQCGLLVSGRDWIDYLSFSGGMPLFVKRVFSDPRWFEAIVAAVEQFEETVAEMVARYETAVVGLPMTERIIEMEMTL